MGIISSLIIGLISGLIYIYFVKYLIKQNASNALDDNIIMRSLSMVQLHILYIFIIYGYVHSIDPMAADRGINALLDDTFIGDIVGFFTDVNTEPNYQAIAIVNEMQSSANMFLIIGLGLCIIESFGLIEKKVNRWIIECISIICTITSYLYLRKLWFFQEEIFSQSKMEGIFNYFGQSFVSSFSWIETMLNIGIIILIINHILQHKALDKYYGETKIKQPSYIIILIAISLGVLYLFNKHFLNPEVILDNNELNNNETYINSQNRKEEYSSIINIAEYHIPKPNDAIFNLNKENGGILQFRNINIEIKIYERNNGFDKYGDDKETGSIQEMFDWDQYSSVRNGYPASIENEIKEEYMICGYGKKIGDDTKIQARFYAEYPESKHLLYAETWVTDEEQLKDFIYLQNNYLKKYTYDTVIKEKTGIQEYMNQILGEYPSNFLENELVKERLIGLMGNKMYYTICSSFERITPIYKHNNNSKNVTFYVIKGFDEFNEVLILYNPETDNLQVKYTDRNGNNGQIYLENEYEYSPFDENVF